MRSKVFVIVTIGILSIFALGMTSKKANEIPIPAKNYKATVIDREGFQTEGTKVSIDGEIFLTLKRGVGTYYVPFEKIKDVELGSEEDNWVAAVVHLIDADDPLQGQVDGLLPCFGETSFGKFELKLKNIKKIVINQEIVGLTK